jgi:hypothetical protein
MLSRAQTPRIRPSVRPRSGGLNGKVRSIAMARRFVVLVAAVLWRNLRPSKSLPVRASTWPLALHPKSSCVGGSSRHSRQASTCSRPSSPPSLDRQVRQHPVGPHRERVGVGRCGFAAPAVQQQDAPEGGALPDPCITPEESRAARSRDRAFAQQFERDSRDPSGAWRRA